jgi:hypothetical protein
LIASIGVAGVAIKNWLSGRPFPAVVPVDHDVPVEFRCTAGTKTL